MIIQIVILVKEIDQSNQRREFPFLQWKELEQEIDNIEAIRSRDTAENR